MAMLWPYLAALGLLAALAWFAWSRRSVPGARPFAVACLFGFLWAAGSAAAMAAPDPAAKLAWHKFQAIWQIPAATAITCFVLEYVQPGRWLTRRNLTLLAIPSFLTLVLILTNDLHHWFWLGFEVGVSVVPLRGPGWWLLFAVSWCMYVVNLVALGWLFAHSPQHRRPVVLMVAGGVAGRLAQIAYSGAGPSVLRLDLPLLTLLIPVCCYAIAMFGFRILDPLPAARRTAIEQMQAGVIVFDAGWQVISLNPAAEGILGVGIGAARGKTWRQLLPSGAPPPDLPDASSHGAGAATDLPDMTFGSASDARQYAPSLSPLRDFRGLLMGYLLMLRDVTEERRAQAQTLARQWALAVLQEREQLAHELHDGLSQDLAFLNLQAQAAELSLQSGRGEAARTGMARLAEVSREMQGDVRELIGNLLVVSLPSEGFCATLCAIATHYQQQYGLPVRLRIDPAAEGLCDSGLLPPAAGVQLVRIVQEALANVRKHAGAPEQVSVELQVNTSLLRLAVSDSGVGFDPNARGAAGRHYGLQVMRGRAERIGGQFAIHTAPGQGTRVEVIVPLRERAGEGDAETQGREEGEMGRGGDILPQQLRDTSP